MCSKILSGNYFCAENRTCLPKPEQKKEDKKIIGWRCKICNYVYEGSNLPEEFTCPLCGHGADDFEPIYENV